MVTGKYGQTDGQTDSTDSTEEKATGDRRGSANKDTDGGRGYSLRGGANKDTDRGRGSANKDTD